MSATTPVPSVSASGATQFEGMRVEAQALGLCDSLENRRIEERREERGRLGRGSGWSGVVAFAFGNLE